jgi:hypothetical protein
LAQIIKRSAVTTGYERADDRGLAALREGRNDEPLLAVRSRRLPIWNRLPMRLWGMAMRKQIWFGCVVCVAAVVPGFLVGGLAAILYKWTTISWLGSEPDVYFMRTLFGIETPGKILGWVVYSAFPTFVRGAVAGAVAAFLTNYAYKGPRRPVHRRGGHERVLILPDAWP